MDFTLIPFGGAVAQLRHLLPITPACMLHALDPRAREPGWRKLNSVIFYKRPPSDSAVPCNLKRRREDEETEENASRIVLAEFVQGRPVPLTEYPLNGVLNDGPLEVDYLALATPEGLPSAVLRYSKLSLEYLDERMLAFVRPHLTFFEIAEKRPDVPLYSITLETLFRRLKSRDLSVVKLPLTLFPDCERFGAIILRFMQHQFYFGLFRNPNRLYFRVSTLDNLIRLLRLNMTELLHKHFPTEVIFEVNFTQDKNVKRRFRNIRRFLDEYYCFYRKRTFGQIRFNYKFRNLCIIYKDKYWHFRRYTDSCTSLASDSDPEM